MRRLFAFISLAFSLLVLCIVGVPTIKKNVNNGTEYAGGNTILYELTDSSGLNYSGLALEQNIEKSTKIINERLNNLSISNPEISIISHSDEDGNHTYLNVQVPEMDDDQLNIVRFTLANNGEISVRDTNDNDLIAAKGYKTEDVIKEIKVTPYGDSTYLTVSLKNASVFEEITSELAANYTGSDDEPTVNMVIWIGFEEVYNEQRVEDTDFTGDKYSEITTNDYAAFKILSRVAVNETISADFSIDSYISTANVSLYNKILSQDKVSYCLYEQYTSPVGNYANTEVPTLAIIGGVVGLVAIIALLVVFYRFAGVISALSITVYAVITLLLYNVFGGLFGAETILALSLGLLLATDANVIFLERIKDEIKKGKRIDRAYEEGSRKSVSTVLDSNVVVLIAALALYLFGTQVIKSFAAIMIIGQVIIMVVVVLLTRYMFSLICKSSLEFNSKKWFGVNKEDIKDINDVEALVKPNKFTKFNFVKNFKMKGIISGGLVLVGVVIGLICELASGTFFNYSTNLKNCDRVYFRTFDTNCETVEGVQNYLEINNLTDKKAAKIIITTDYEQLDESKINSMKNDSYFAGDGDTQAIMNIDFDVVSNYKLPVYSVEILFNNLSSDDKNAFDTFFNDQELKLFDKDNEIDYLEMNYTIGSYKPYSGSKSATKGLLVIGMVCVFTFIYLAIRFSSSYAITSCLSLIANEFVFYGLLAILRIQVGVEAIAGGLALAILTISSICTTFDKLKDNISEARDVIWNLESRKEFMNKSLQETMFGHLFLSIAGLALSIILLCFIGGSAFSIPSLFALVIIVSAFGSYLLMPHIWCKLDDVFAIAKGKAKQRKALKTANKVSNEPADEQKEYVFFGIND